MTSLDTYAYNILSYTAKIVIVMLIMISPAILEAIFNHLLDL